METQRRHALKLHARSLDTVHDLKQQLKIMTRWVRGSTEWMATSTMVNNWRYQCALNHLEGLVVQCMFKLTKVNMSGTGEFAT